MRTPSRQIARRRGWDVDVVPVPALLHNRPIPLKVLVTVPFRFAVPKYR